jgi:ABC-type lipoprotein export system ATPase subunit
MNEPMIVCENLVKIYKADELEIVALQGLDLVVQQGEMVGMVGVSGSGKSTLMNVIGGLDRPSAGRIRVGGRDLLKLSAKELDRYRREHVGFVWQQVARNLIPYLSALENVKLPLNLAGGLTRATEAHCKGLLEAVGLADRIHHKLGELSGGQQQRVAIAVALANQPRLLLADEPTGEVDSQTALDIYRTFRRLNQDFGLTTVIVSHDPGIARHVDRVVAIRDGRLSSETVRQPEAGRHDGEDTFEELIVLDAAGRLQIPKEIREELGLRGRARLEVTPQGLLVRSVARADHAHGTTGRANEPAPRPRRSLPGNLLRRRKRAAGGDGGGHE